MSSETVSCETIDNAAVVEWHDLNPDDETAKRRVTQLLGRDGVDAYVAIDRTDDYISPETSDAIDRLADRVRENGIERVALVGEAIKALAAKGAFDGPGTEVYMSEDRREAVEWATDG
jgi:hypothetical protein